MIVKFNELPVNITMQVISFRNFLVTSWPHIDNLMKDHDWHDDTDYIIDWLQVSWEFFLERELLGKDKYLMPWCVEDRVTYEDAKPTYAIVTKILTNLVDIRTKKHVPKNCWLRLSFFLKVSSEGYLGIYPPFDYVELLLDSKRTEKFTVPIEGLKFYLIEWDSGKNCPKE